MRNDKIVGLNKNPFPIQQNVENRANLNKCSENAVFYLEYPQYDEKDTQSYVYPAFGKNLGQKPSKRVISHGIYHFHCVFTEKFPLET